MKQDKRVEIKNRYVNAKDFNNNALKTNFVYYKKVKSDLRKIKEKTTFRNLLIIYLATCKSQLITCP